MAITKEQLLAFTPIDTQKARTAISQQGIENKWEGGGALTQIDEYLRDLSVVQTDLNNPNITAGQQAESLRLGEEAMQNIQSLQGVLPENVVQEAIGAIPDEAVKMQKQVAGQRQARVEEPRAYTQEDVLRIRDDLIGQGIESNQALSMSQSYLKTKKPEMLNVPSTEDIKLKDFVSTATPGVQDLKVGKDLVIPATGSSNLNNLVNAINFSNTQLISDLNEKFKLPELKTQINEITNKMNEKILALSLGESAEIDRIAPLQIQSRRINKLRQQAQHEISVLSVASQALANQYELATQQMQIFSEAAIADNNARIKTFDLLFALEQAEVARLRQDEKEALKMEREDLLLENAKIEKDKDRVLSLILSNPLASTRANISLTDDYESAVGKLTPELAKLEQATLAPARGRGVAGGTSFVASTPTMSLSEFAENWMAENKMSVPIENLQDEYNDYLSSAQGQKTGLIDTWVDLLGKGQANVSNVPQSIRNDVIARVGSTGSSINKTLSDGAISNITQLQSAILSLDTLENVITANSEYIGPISGWQSLNPWSKARRVQAEVDRVRQTVGKALEGGVLRKEDEEKYKKILATLTDTPDTAMYKITSLRNQINKDIANYSLLQQQSGRYVSDNISQPLNAGSARDKYNY